MKNLLIATTALVATAGMASAEISFSGKGEAGMYRDGKTAAGAAVAGTSVEVIDDQDARFLTDFLTQVGVAADADADVPVVEALAAAVTIGYNADGVLTTVANSGVLSVNVTAADEDGAAVTLNTITNMTEAVRTVKAEVALRTRQLAEVQDGNGDNENRDLAISALADAQGALALVEAALAAAVGTLPVDAVAASDMTAYSGYDMNVAASLETDGGLTFGMGFDMGAGQIADQNDDRAMDPQGAEITTSALTVGMNGYTLKIGQDKVDDTYDDGQNGDIGLSGNVGGVAFNLVHDLDDEVVGVAASTVYTAAVGTAGQVGYVASTFTQNAAVDATIETTSLSLGGAVGDIAWSLAATNGNKFGDAAAKGSLTYSGIENLSLTLAHDNVGELDGITKVTAAYTMGALKATLSMADDKDKNSNSNTGGKASNNLSLAYAANGLAATFATDESSQWWVNTQYDLGGGAQAFATIDHTEFAVFGVNFNF